MNANILHDDLYYMNVALEYACKAAQSNEVPIGAIVVDADGVIIGTGYNQVEGKKSPCAHAEMFAIEQAAQSIEDWRLDGCSIYVTLEPCRMCMGLIQLSRLSRMIYATDSPRFGHQLDNTAISSVYKKDVIVKKGICADKSRHILKQFFQQKRKKKDERKKTQYGRDQKGADRAKKRDRRATSASCERKSV